MNHTRTQHESVYIQFHIYVNIDLTKLLHVHFYIVSESGENGITNYVDITQSVDASFVDNKVHVKIN